MNMRLAYAVMAIAIAAVVAVALSLGHNGSAPSPSGSTLQSTVAVSANSKPSATLFSSTSYYPYSYLISTQPLTQEAQTALAGFSLNTTTFSNGTKEIMITLKSSGQSQSVMLEPNDSLYIVETAFGDDSYNFDASFADDGFVMVNQTGYVV